MIDNDICPYCCKPMVKAENQENSKSVEHLIPNAVLTRKRKNDEGDFYACRKCNSRKSNIDYVLGVISKCQADDNELASNTLIKAVTKSDGASKKFIRMVQCVKELSGEIHMTMPIGGEEIVEYIEFLGKGQFFKKNKAVFNPKAFVFDITFANKQVARHFQESYEMQHQSNPFRDLEQNGYSEVINGGECIIYSKNRRYMFLFHDYTVVTVKVLRKNKKNMTLCAKKVENLISDFNEKI